MVKYKIKELIAKNETLEVLNLLKQVIPVQSHLYNELLIVEGQFNDFQSTSRTNTDRAENLGVKKSQIDKALLQIVDQVFSQEKQSLQLPPLPTKKPKYQRWKYIISITIIIITFGALAEVLNVIHLFPISTIGNRSGSVTVLVHSKESKEKLILPSRGVVKLVYGDAIISKQINNEGEATFKQVPDRFFQSGEQVEILFRDPLEEPYRAVHQDSLYQLRRGEYISLPVQLQGLGQIRGIVKDFRSGDPISGVRISVQGAESFSNQYGEYTLQIPVEKQSQFQTIRAYKEGYKSLEQSNVPIQTKREVPLLLKPKE